MTVQTLQKALEHVLSARGARLLTLRRLPGGASQEIWAVRIEEEREGKQTTARDVVLRRDMGGALSTLARTRSEEYALLAEAHEAGVAVPRLLYEPLVIDGHDAFFMELIPGETVGKRIVHDPVYRQARQRLPEQVTQALVTLHAIDHTRLPFLGAPRTAIDLVNALERDLDACGEGHPAFELGLRWLRVNAPPLVRPTLVHGDFRMGNFVVDTEGLRSVLDWELAHVGDPAEDLGWLCVRAWRFGADELPAGGITTREQLLALYEQAGGPAITLAQLHYWELFGNVKWGIIALSQAARHLQGLSCSVELATLGRVAAEMEWETLQLFSRMGA